MNLLRTQPTLKDTRRRTCRNLFNRYQHRTDPIGFTNRISCSASTPRCRGISPLRRTFRTVEIKPRTYLLDIGRHKKTQAPGLTCSALEIVSSIQTIDTCYFRKIVSVYPVRLGSFASRPSVVCTKHELGRNSTISSRRRDRTADDAGVHTGKTRVDRRPRVRLDLGVRSSGVESLSGVRSVSCPAVARAESVSYQGRQDPEGEASNASLSDLHVRSPRVKF